jgi:hypothetical protein
MIIGLDICELQELESWAAENLAILDDVLTGCAWNSLRKVVFQFCHDYNNSAPSIIEVNMPRLVEKGILCITPFDNAASRCFPIYPP